MEQQHQQQQHQQHQQSSANPDFEELTICGYCKQKFNETDQSPKMLSCKHYFCLQCMRTSLVKNQNELFCVHCWKRTEIGDLGPESLPTYTPVLHLAKNLAQLKIEKAPQPQPPPPTKPPPSLPLSENCHTHAMPLALWCHSCCAPLCRACASCDHATHQIKSHADARDQLINEVHVDLLSMSKMLTELQKLANQQREFLLKILEACVTLKTHVEADLTSAPAHEPSETRDLLAKARASLNVAESLCDVQRLHATLSVEKQRLQAKVHEMYFQCQLDDLIRNAQVVLDFQLLKQAVAGIQSGVNFDHVSSNSNHGSLSHSHSHHHQMIRHQNPILFLANYCLSQLYSRNAIFNKNHSYLTNGNNVDHHLVYDSGGGGSGGGGSVGGSLVMAPPPNALAVAAAAPATQSQSLIKNPNNSSACPLYYFNVEVNGTAVGRVVIEVRADVAPKMAKNFGLLATGETGMGYRGCAIFQCWEGESVITGDFELNNGRGGRSVFEDAYFLPDDTKLMATRGTVGMRRTQKRHDNLGMVGSQFRIILQEMRGFTGIFGHVVEGLELVEKISTYGDNAGKPTKNIVIAKCGKL